MKKKAFILLSLALLLTSTPVSAEVVSSADGMIYAHESGSLNSYVDIQDAIKHVEIRFSSGDQPYFFTYDFKDGISSIQTNLSSTGSDWALSYYVKDDPSALLIYPRAHTLSITGIDEISVNGSSLSRKDGYRFFFDGLGTPDRSVNLYPNGGAYLVESVSDGSSLIRLSYLVYPNGTCSSAVLSILF